MHTGGERTLRENAFSLFRDAETKAATHFSNGATVTCHKISDFLWMIGSGPNFRVLGFERAKLLDRYEFGLNAKKSRLCAVT
jgi:hypothetical protein